jgi:hypothetical protein
MHYVDYPVMEVVTDHDFVPIQYLYPARLIQKRLR